MTAQTSAASGTGDDISMKPAAPQTMPSASSQASVMRLQPGAARPAQPVVAHADVDARRGHAQLDHQPAVDQPGRHGHAAQLQRQEDGKGGGHQRAQPRVTEHHVQLFVADLGAQRRVELQAEALAEARGAGKAGGSSPCTWQRRAVRALTTR